MMIKFIILIQLLFGLYILAHGNDKVNKKKINNFMKDLYNLENLSDLSKLGIQINRAPSSIKGRSGPITAGMLGPSALLAGDVKDATPGKCDPKPVCISNPLTLDMNSNQLAFPPCINIHRCDGCCPTNEKCVAIKSHEVKLQKVGIINFDGENQPKYEERMVSVSNHTECQCQCAWESDEDCKKVNKNYVKSQYECACECPEELSCDAFHEFDKEHCGCRCRRDKFLKLEQACKAKGFNWNDDSCKCEVSRLSVSHKEIRITK